MNANEMKPTRGLPGRAQTDMLFPYRLTDSQWALLEPVLDEAKRKRQHPLREITETILYVLEQGCKWRSLPGRIKWQLAYYYFRAWKKDGTIIRLQTHLLPLLRQSQSRSGPCPEAGVIDAQSVKTKHGGQRKGYDGAKKISGRKRLVLTDLAGNVLAVLVQSGREHDSSHVGALLRQARRRGLAHCIIEVFADLAFTRQGKEQAARQGVNLVVVGEQTRRRTKDEMAAGIKPFARPQAGKAYNLPRRWVIERTFAWLGNYRRLSKDYERTTSSSAALIMLAAIFMAVFKI